MYYCTGCGAPITPADQFCKQCGKKAETTAKLVQAPRKKKTAMWVKVIGGFFLCFLFLFTWLGLSYTNLEEPALEQLQAIKEGNVSKAYYEYTSEGFQNATSLEEFRNFVKNYPMLIKNTEAQFDKPQIGQNNEGLLRGVLTSKAGEQAVIEYVLSRDDGDWKIHSMRLEATGIDPDGALVKEFSSDKEKNILTLPVTNQLEDLKKGKISKAYDDVSEGFKKATSREQFQAFLKQFPALTMHTRVNFQNPAIHGDRAAIQAFLTTPGGEVPVQYYLIKDGGQWRIWSLQVQVPQTEEQGPMMTLMLAPVKEQLKDLKEENFHDAYYDNVSNEFRRISPFSTFKAFVERFDILKDYNNVDFKEPRMEDNLGKMTVVLHRDDGSKATLEYTLGYEEGVWKIRGLHLSSGRKSLKDTKIKKLADTGDFQEEELEEVAKEQLQAIQENEWEDAYEDFTSEQFQRATSFDVFKQFVRSHEFFKDAEDVKFSKLMFNNNIATLKGEFFGADGKQYPVEYDFILQGDEWKILRIHVDIETMQNAMAEGELRYPKIVVGNEVDARGLVIDEKNIFDNRERKIYANVYVQNGREGDEISVMFKHLKSGSAIPAVKTKLPQDGVTVASFVFNPPPAGWPTGKYQLEISSSTGVDEYYLFEVQ